MGEWRKGCPCAAGTGTALAARSSGCAHPRAQHRWKGAACPIAGECCPSLQPCSGLPPSASLVGYRNLSKLFPVTCCSRSLEGCREKETSQATKEASPHLSQGFSATLTPQGNALAFGSAPATSTAREQRGPHVCSKQPPLHCKTGATPRIRAPLRKSRPTHPSTDLTLPREGRKPGAAWLHAKIFLFCTTLLPLLMFQDCGNFTCCCLSQWGPGSPGSSREIFPNPLAACTSPRAEAAGAASTTWPSTTWCQWHGAGTPRCMAAPGPQPPPAEGVQFGEPQRDVGREKCCKASLCSAPRKTERALQPS